MTRAVALLQIFSKCADAPVQSSMAVLCWPEVGSIMHSTRHCANARRICFFSQPMAVLFQLKRWARQHVVCVQVFYTGCAKPFMLKNRQIMH